MSKPDKAKADPAGGWFPAPRRLIGTAKRPNPWFQNVNGHTFKVLAWLAAQWKDERGEIRATLSQISKGCGGSRGTNSRAIQTLITDGKIKLVERGSPGKPSIYQLPESCASATSMVAPEDQHGCAGATNVVAPVAHDCCASGAPLKTSLKTSLKTINNNTPPAAADGGVGLTSSGGEDEDQTRIAEVTAALRRAGIRGKVREELSRIPGLTAAVVSRVASDVTQQGGRTGVLIATLREDGEHLANEKPRWGQLLPERRQREDDDNGFKRSTTVEDLLAACPNYTREYAEAVIRANKNGEPPVPLPPECDPRAYAERQRATRDEARREQQKRQQEEDERKRQEIERQWEESNRLAAERKAAADEFVGQFTPDQWEGIERAYAKRWPTPFRLAPNPASRVEMVIDAIKSGKLQTSEAAYA